jgi:signal transduction histidine kinase
MGELMARDLSLSPMEALDAFVEVLGEAEAGVTTDAFYGRLCQVICELAGMDRGVLFRYDEVIRRVRAAGAFGLDVAIFEDAQVSVESTPIARRAFESDAVVEAHPPFAGELPERYIALLREGTLYCVPMAAAGRWVGVVLCHQPQGATLSERERHVLWTLGKTAALAAVARIATFEGERARELQHRIDLAREVHDGVVQRLFGVSLALDADGEFPPDTRKRAAAEIQQALSELRSAMQRPLSRAPRPTQVTLADEVRRLAHRHADLAIEVDPDSELAVPQHLESIAQSVLAEALRNAHKHAQPNRVTVRAGLEDGAFTMEVFNDGVSTPVPGSAGMGLRLVAFEALRAGGVVEFGRRDGGWQVRLVVPVDDAA